MNEVVDIMIYEGGSGGDMNIKNGDVEIIKGITNQVYLALFGGNVEQDTSIDLQDVEQRFDYWGNEYLTDEEQFNSNFERTISQIILNSAGINTLVEAAKSDLKYLEKYADIEIDGSIITFNRFQLDVKLTEPGSQSIKIKFIWDGTRNEVIQEILI